MASAKDARILLQNRFVLRELRKEAEGWRTVRFARADGADVLTVESDEFDLLLLDGTELSVADYRVRGEPILSREGARQVLQIVYEPRKPLSEAAPTLITVEYFLADEPYLRKRVTLEMKEGQAIDRLEVERFSTTAKGSRGGRGEPVFVGDAWFFGLEHPAAQTRHSDGFTGRPYDKIGNYSWVNLEGHDRETRPRAGLITVMQFPRAQKEEKLGHSVIISASAVAGVGQKGDSMELVFRDYFDTIRKSPRSFVHYNNWFDGSGKDLRPANFAEKVTRTFQKKLQPYGIQMDAMCPDNGWQNGQSIWQPSQGYFPKGWSDVEALSSAVEKEGSHLGIWIAANGCQLDIGWGVKNGFAQAKHSGAYRTYYPTFCVVQPQYRAAMFDAFQSLITQGKLNYIKHDFNTQSCVGEGHGHLATDRHGHEASVSTMMDLLAYERKLNPQIYQNFTNWMWFSPWWLQHCDTVWMLSDDTGLNRKWPQLANSAMATTYRDSHLHRIWGDPATRPLVPISALMTHGIVYASGESDLGKNETPQEWADYVTGYCGRGVMLKELYITPSLMKPIQWEILGTTLRWANANAEILANAVLIGGDPAKGEPHGYVAWKGDRALLLLRNPDIHEQNMRVPFDKTVFYRGKNGETYHARVLYPYFEELSQKFVSGQDLQWTLPSLSFMIFELQAGAPTVSKTTALPSPPVIKEKTEAAFSLPIPDEEMLRCDLILLGNRALPLLTLDGQQTKPSRTNNGEGWQMASYDLRDFRGKSVRVEGIGAALGSEPFPAAAGGRLSVSLLADRPLSQKGAAVLPAPQAERLPYLAFQNYRRQTVTILDSSERAPQNRRIPLTADQLKTVKTAKLRMEVFGSNGEPEYLNKQILFNGERLATVPVSPDGDHWQEFILDLPAPMLSKLKLTNSVEVTNATDDHFKFKGLALAVQISDGQWVQSTADLKVHSSHADWAYVEGEPFQKNSSGQILLSLE